MGKGQLIKTYSSRYQEQRLPQRIIWMLVAVILMGFGVSICFIAEMGSDPCSTMNQGVAMQLGFSFGTWNALWNVILLVGVFIFQRSMIGIGTFGNMFLVGFSADFFKPILLSFVEQSTLNIPVRVALTLLGTFIIIAACSLYMTSNLGMAPYDCIAFIVINKVKKRKLKYRWVRISQDAIALLIGFLCGASVGIGTVIMVFMIGPLIPLFNKHMSAKLIGIEKIKT